MKGFMKGYTSPIHWIMKGLKGYEGFTPYVDSVEQFHADTRKRRTIILHGQHKGQTLHNPSYPSYLGVIADPKPFINPSYSGSIAKAPEHGKLPQGAATCNKAYTRKGNE